MKTWTYKIRLQKAMASRPTLLDYNALWKKHYRMAEQKLPRRALMSFLQGLKSVAGLKEQIFHIPSIVEAEVVAEDFMSEGASVSIDLVNDDDFTVNAIFYNEHEELKAHG